MSDTNSEARAASISGHWLLGHLPELGRSPLELYQRAHREGGDLVALRSVPGRHWFFAAHPDAVARVLQGNGANYGKPDFFTEPTSLLGGQGLLTAQGDPWLRQRRLAQPAFHRQRLEPLAAMMAQAAQQTADEWESVLARGESKVDVWPAMTRLTLRVASRALFSTDVSAQTARIARAVAAAFEVLNYRMTHRFSAPPLWLATARHRRLKRSITTLDEIVFGLIRERRRNSGPSDLLAMLMDAHDEDGSGMSDRQLRDEVMTLMIAGYETTASALSWAWLLLAKHPGKRAILHAELAQVLGGRAPSLEDLPRLPYTRQVLLESMRLFPPAWVLPRVALGDDSLLGCSIPRGAIVILSPFVTHRHPDFWERPEEFEPERFAPEHEAQRPRFAYFPFGGGARLCIGREFALMEAHIALATLAQRFHLGLLPGCKIELDPTFTLRPRVGQRNSLPMRLRAAITGDD
jgi:cytochrome P450